MTIQSSIVDKWGVIEGEIRIFEEKEVVSALESKLRFFKKDKDYSVVGDNRKETYTIYSDRLKKSIWEIEAIGYSSPLLRNAPRGTKAGKIVIEVDRQARANKDKFQSTCQDYQTDSLESLFLRDKAKEISNENNSPERFMEIDEPIRGDSRGKETCLPNIGSNQHSEQLSPALDYKEWQKIGRQQGWLSVVTLFAFLSFLL